MLNVLFSQTMGLMPLKIESSIHFPPLTYQIFNSGVDVEFLENKNTQSTVCRDARHTKGWRGFSLKRFGTFQICTKFSYIFRRRRRLAVVVVWCCCCYHQRKKNARFTHHSIYSTFYYCHPNVDKSWKHIFWIKHTRCTMYTHCQPFTGSKSCKKGIILYFVWYLNIAWIIVIVSRKLLWCHFMREKRKKKSSLHWFEYRQNVYKDTKSISFHKIACMCKMKFAIWRRSNWLNNMKI